MLSYLRLIFLTLCVLALSAEHAEAQTQNLSAQARVHFEEGNEDFERAMRLRGTRRTQALQDALAHYASSLAITRSRNVLFNTALAFEELGQLEDAFSHFAEYAAMDGLSEEEERAGRNRLDALRPQVAVVRIESTPSGAEVRIGRLDLPSAGSTPLETALPPGSHRLFLALPHHESAMDTVVAARGERQTLQINLRASPVGLVIEAPQGASVTLDDIPVTSGIRLRVAPGEHQIQMALPGHDHLRRSITLSPGAEDTVLRLEPQIPENQRSSLSLTTNVNARLFIDGVMRSEGLLHEHRLAPGTHQIRITGVDHQSYTGEVVLRADQETTAAVTLVQDNRRAQERQRRTRIWSTTIASILTAGAVTAALLARGAHDDWERAAARYEGSPTDENRELGQEAANDLDRANLTADIFMGAGAVSLTFAAVSWLRNSASEESPESQATFAIAPLRDGAMVLAQGSLGDAP